MEKAIKKAIEGGYKNSFIEIYKGDVYIFGEKIVVEKLLLDPLFWQALGKKEGWKWHCTECWKEQNFEEFYCEECEKKVSLKIGWEYQWHSFVEHLANNKDIDNFFEDLLT